MRFKTHACETIKDNACTSSSTHPEEKNQGKRDFNLIFNQLFQKSSVLVVSRIRLSPNPFRKLVWMFILMGGLAITVYQVFRFLKVFLQYPVITSLRLEQKYFVKFPAVTVCNLNRMKHKHLKCLHSVFPLDSCFSGAEIPNLFMSKRTGLYSCSSEFSGNSDAEKDDTIHFLKTYLAVSEERRKEAGYKSEEFITQCSFNGKPCSVKDFAEFQSLRYGNCFTFNKFNQNISETLMISQTGDQNGLVLVLDLSHLDYLKISSTIGARVIIHDPKEEPSFVDTGNNIAAGYETSVMLSETFFGRLRSPYRDHCGEYKGKNIWPYHESYNKCKRICIQEVSFKTCGCVDPTLPSTASRKLCNVTDKSEMCCLDKALNLLLQQNTDCDCPLPCSATNYGEMISVARWPSASSFLTGEARGKYYSHSFEYFRRSQAKLKIFFSSLVQKIYVQKPKFHPSEVFSHLGGELGIWLGISLWVILELFEAIYFLAKYLVDFLRRYFFK
ncbi:hypothetical protein TNIN_370151 [Trichonephila inaurata madagascariensis]|uniref:Uncharacterized protein n=1 Tax=Trichonephila inaurata madagascariensis TaxID=2747483 RepID=A0A8X6YPV0_9ARAC|nr:hypothetical protein TNIN_370151 [Trichonephila inaurata madagascariensis]